MGTILEKLQGVLNTKGSIRQAIISMGQAVAETDPFASYPDKIRAIRTGVETGDATAGAGDILSGKTAYVKGQKITGTIQSQAAKIITPGTVTQTAVAKGMYTTGTVTVAGSSNLVADNIRSGVNVFDVTGTYSGQQVKSQQFSNAVVRKVSGTSLKVISSSLPRDVNSILAFFLTISGEMTISPDNIKAKFARLVYSDYITYSDYNFGYDYRGFLYYSKDSSTPGATISRINVQSDGYMVNFYNSNSIIACENTGTTGLVIYT